MLQTSSTFFINVIDKEVNVTIVSEGSELTFNDNHPKINENSPNGTILATVYVGAVAPVTLDLLPLTEDPFPFKVDDQPTCISYVCSSHIIL